MRRLRAARYGRLAGFAVFEAPPRRRSRMLIGVSGGELRWLAVVDPRRVGAAALPRLLRRLLADPAGARSSD